MDLIEGKYSPQLFVRVSPANDGDVIDFGKTIEEVAEIGEDVEVAIYEFKAIVTVQTEVALKPIVEATTHEQPEPPQS